MTETRYGDKYSGEYIQQLLGAVRSIAMVGASADPAKPSNQVLQFLLSAGYEVIPVNPRPDMTEICGLKVYPSLQSIDRPVDMVDVFRPPSELEGIVREAQQIGAKVLWAQLGIHDEEAERIAEQGGMKVVMDRCPKIELGDPILLRERTSEGILRLTLNDTERRNALSMDMLKQLRTALDQAAEDASVRVIILAANGRAFSAGHDLREMTQARQAPDGGKAFFEETMAACCGVMQGIVTNPKPVIAEVNGVATAAGCQLVASCDLAYASPSARFATPGVSIGLFCSTPMVALSRNVGNKAAMEMLLTGEMIDAERAADIGLINRAVPEEQLSDYTHGIAQTIASKSSMTLKTGKQAFYRQQEMSLAEAYEYTSRVMVDNLMTHDAEEGINAFIGKRDPEWSDH